jgi:hypothetical protein
MLDSCPVVKAARRWLWGRTGAAQCSDALPHGTRDRLCSSDGRSVLRRCRPVLGGTRPGRVQPVMTFAEQQACFDAYFLSRDPGHPPEAVQGQVGSQPATPGPLAARLLALQATRAFHTFQDSIVSAASVELTATTNAQVTDQRTGHACMGSGCYVVCRAPWHDRAAHAHVDRLVGSPGVTAPSSSHFA